MMLDGVADDLKMVLSEPNLFKTLLAVMEKCERNAAAAAAADDQSTLVNLMADLIVLLLTGGTSVVYRKNVQ